MDSTVARGRLASAELGQAAHLLVNLSRVVLAWAWTVGVGMPAVVIIYTRYWWALLGARIGAADTVDRAIESNAFLMGWVAQRLWASVLFPLLGVPLSSSQRADVDWSKTHVICSNHASILDILALARVVPPPFRFVAKQELTRWPIIGWVLRPAGQIIIDRSDARQAVESIAAAAAHPIRGQVIFFVEGTRSRSGLLQPFKKGAFQFAVRNDLPVLPVAIHGSYDALAKLPWWRLRSDCPVDVRICSPIAQSARTRATVIETEVEALRSATRVAIQKSLLG